MNNKSNNSLKSRCNVVTQEEGDRFVGIKVDVNKAVVYFPLGFQIPENDTEIRRDILHLLNIIKEFKDKEEGRISFDNNEFSDIVEFPLNSYLEVISYFMENGYYIEYDPVYNTRTKGNINWTITIKNQKPLLQENNGSYSPIYTKFTVKEITPNENKEIIYIFKHCVYESFEKLGWLFTSFVPPKPNGNLDKERFLPIIYNKLANTFKDSEKKLFKAMIDILEKMDSHDNKIQYYFGTENFEHVWERLIDNAFGIPNKEDYYPRGQWNLEQGKRTDLKYALQPDTIMEYEGKIYVIDSKYYKFGATKNPDHLPKTTDINKQITYAEFIQKNKKDFDVEKIYNAFLMPYNKDYNSFNSNEIYFCIGEATGDWRTHKFKYEHIQGILVDIKYLMYNYKGNKNSKMLQLSKIIEEAYEKNNG